MRTVPLVDIYGRAYNYKVEGSRNWSIPEKPAFNRIAFSAAHVVSNPLVEHDRWLTASVDWEGTLAYRRHLLSLGLGIAEAMDTAQRGMGLDWPTSLELIQRSVEQAKDFPGARVASGVGTDHLTSFAGLSVDDVIDAYEEQVASVEACGGRIILMASRALVAVAKGPDDYLKVYGHILSQVREPVILHWLGDMFDPALAGYWGSDDVDQAMEVCLTLIREYASKVDGIKISLLDKSKEIYMRRQLPSSVKMYTGDDFNYAELIEGDEQGYSHALLGIFDAVAPAAASALDALAKGDNQKFRAILEPTVPLSRHIFKAPTRFYKSGIVFLAWLNGHQNHFAMVGGQESTRSFPHYAELFRLADEAGLLEKPDLAIQRMTAFAFMNGVGA